MRFTNIAKTASALAVALVLSIPLLGKDVRYTASPNDQQIQQLASQELQKKEKLRGVSASVEDAIVTLSGNVDLLIDKANAEKRVRKVKSVDGVRNHIQIVGKQVSDADLRETVSNKLRYDRVGYGITFNNLTVAVDNGIVTVGGNVRDYPDRESAIAILETTPGVKDVVDEVNVAPVSTFDDQLRIRLARAIYGHPSLQMYALDPQAPIRIVVQNGNVELAGIVRSDADRQIAFMQASAVPGVFSVQNNLMVASTVTR
jgi:osmotically-inducible protein OsmY